MKFQTAKEQAGPNQELDALMKLFDAFTGSMREELLAHYAHGDKGWDDPAWTKDHIKERLEMAVGFHNMVDVANFAMFFWNKQP